MFFALDVAVLYYVLDLLIFHIRLLIEGNTTYDIIRNVMHRYTHFKKLKAAEKQKKAEKKRRQSSQDSIQGEFLLFFSPPVHPSGANATPLSIMLEGNGKVIPAMTPSPISQSITPKSEGTQSDPSIVLKSPHSDSLSPLGDRDNSFALQRGNRRMHYEE